MRENTQWGSNPIKDAKLNNTQYKELCANIIEIGKDRKQCTGELNEGDFFCGAMAVMERLGIGCPPWPLMIMAGRSLVDEENETK